MNDDSSAVSLSADMRLLHAGADPIPCRTWDFGHPVRGYAWRAPRPRGIALLQHGFGVHTGLFVRQYSALVPHLLDIGLDVYGFDMEGHGRSPGRPALTDVRRAVRQHAAAVRMLLERGLPLFVYGHSLGGWVTASSIARHPAGVAGAILSSAVLQEPVGILPTALIKLLSIVAPGRRAPLPVSERSTLSRLPLVDDPLNYRGFGTTNIVASTALALAAGSWRRFASWHTPTLVLHGTDDSSTDHAQSRKFFETIPAQDRTLKLIESGRHELLNDSDRDQVLAIMLDWLRSRLPEAAGPPVPNEHEGVDQRVDVRSVP